MGKKEQINVHKDKERVQAVLQLLKKQAPLTVKQEKFCNSGCVERFLKVKGENVKKAAKQLRNCLAWRDSLGTDYLIADEFSAELAEGAAYVSGHDDESRPVVIFRIKQDYQKFHSQKLFTRLLVFTLEVAIQTMAKSVEQFVVLFDASFFRSASAFMNILLASLKIIADYYPGRLHKAFVIDPPSLFSYLWKGVKTFVDLASLTMVVSSLDFEESLEFNDFTAYPRAASLRFNPSSIPCSSGKIGSCSSSRFSFTVSHHFDSVKPWYLSLTDTSSAKVGPTTTPAISPLNARSYSFASPIARTPRGNIKKGFFPSTPLPQKTQELDPSEIRHPRANTSTRLSFFQSPAMFFKKDNNNCHISKCRESFQPFLKFYRRPYDEMIYRSKMRPPLGGLISIVSPHIRRRHMSLSQRF
ncbi:phosphatidylinositol/phosphatidylcholine transfer protein SFH4-like [Nicotiana tomentosiformis]|uniref:phosphatidylinositol/phosphatidylcholine transfer protein SFH4-like n=1 Tax=Nicotiana tomentosiformis TaxID=4098 RepID=UPI00051C876A|nr:phosphatidylinositol/phosphatidylcholine transfer protein SFH4-like [Nicotiana tomentosiformis]